MNIVWTNWKLVLVWRKGLLAVPALLLLALMMRDLEPVYFLCFVIMFLRPFSNVHSDFADKAFCFCLPGYRAMLRRMILTDAVFGGLLFSICGAQWAAEEIWPIVGLYAFTGFVAGFAFSILGGTFDLFPFVMAPAVDVLLSIPFCLGALIVLGMLVLCPWLICPAVNLMCIVVSVFVWRRLCDARDVAHAHRMAIDGLRRKLAHAWSTYRSSSWAEQFFVTRMMRSLGLGRHIWGDLYREFAPFLAYWRRSVVLLFVCTLVVGFTGRVFESLAFLAMAWFAVAVDLPIQSNMLLTEGRSERFWSSVTKAVVTSVLLLGFASAIVALSWPLAAMIADIPLGIATLRYAPIESGNIWLACLLVPWFFGAHLFEREAPIAAFAPTGAAAALLLLGVFLPTYDLCSDPQKITRIIFTATFLAGWLFFLLALRWVCARGCLGTPSAGSRRVEGT